MSKNSINKRRLLIVLRYLWINTDKEHPVTHSDLLKELKAYGIETKGATIQDDIEILQFLGFNVSTERRGLTYEYCLKSRIFEDAEIKMLIDMARSSNFLSDYRKDDLIRRLKLLTSKFASEKFERKIFYTISDADLSHLHNDVIEKLYTAIYKKSRVDFYYMTYDLNKKLVKKREERYIISPISLMWDNKYYYLIGYCHREKKTKYFRVDKIADVRELDAIPRYVLKMNREKIENEAKRTVSMFHGEERVVKLRCNNMLIGSVIDRFGKDIYIKPIDEECFEAHVKTSFSNTVIGWILGIKDAQIIGPPDLVEAVKTFLAMQMNKYC